MRLVIVQKLHQDQPLLLTSKQVDLTERLPDLANTDNMHCNKNNIKYNPQLPITTKGSILKIQIIYLYI
jgi:hypothetical protein